MTKISIKYNPYTVLTTIQIDGKNIAGNSPLMYTRNLRLQEWIEPRGSKKDIFTELYDNIGDSHIQVDFYGTDADFRDLEYAKEKYGHCLKEVVLNHVNKESSNSVSPMEKMNKLKKLYQKLMDGPIEEFKSEDIQQNFEEAMNSDFRIVVVASMSSGKSTLLNAFLGHDLLPAVNQATTAVITEIRDNDELDVMKIEAIDRNGKKLTKKDEIATKERIKELNYKKITDDPDEKESLVKRMLLEGPIPNIPSDTLHTVFIDTPGGNNSQNMEHEKIMNEAIYDDNRSLILYVFNAQNAETFDSDHILDKIADAMKAKGKQSRDRFLFVANKMDVYDTEKGERYEDIVNKTLVPMLERKKIYEPNLFLVSAQLAKLIRMHVNNEKMTTKETEFLYAEMNNFCKNSLIPFASINSENKEKMLDEVAKYTKTIEEQSDVEASHERCRLAELNSGVPAVEKAICEYLEKYAIAIKIKAVHDTFMRKVEERNMIANCEEKWVSSTKEFKEIQKKIKEKQKECDHTKKLQELEGKTRSITLEKQSITEEVGKMKKELGKVIRDDSTEKTFGFITVKGDKLQKKEAESILEEFLKQIKSKAPRWEKKIDDAFEMSMRGSCAAIVDEYKAYLEELKTTGFFDLGIYDMTKLGIYESVENVSVTSVISKHVKKEKYIVHEKGDLKGESLGGTIGNFLLALVSFGKLGTYKHDVTRTEEWVSKKDVQNEMIRLLESELNKAVEKRIKEVEKRLESAKRELIEELKGLDKKIEEHLSMLSDLTSDQEELKKKVEREKENTEWIRSFVAEVDELLAV